MMWPLDELIEESVEPAVAVFPLAAYLVFFSKASEMLAGIEAPWIFKQEMIAGVPISVLGLGLFKWGLKVGLLPLGEQLGEKLPAKVGVAVTCSIGFVLAIFLAYAEPAIGALQEAATLLDVRRAPLLAAIFGNPVCLMLLLTTIGVGGGVAVLTSVLRLLWGWDYKRMVVWALMPCLVLSAACCSLSFNVRSVVGLAWDSGAITTGPVTVPIYIAFGIGLANFNSEQQAKRGEAPTPGSITTDDELKGFGIITFAALWPVLGVMLLGLSLNSLHMADKPDLDLHRSAPDLHTPGPPETYLAFRSIGPLAVILLFLQKFVFRERIKDEKVVALGVLSTFLGLISFNLGLNFGLLPLGDAAGERMATAYETLVEKDRPVTGVSLVCCFAFVMTFAAQVAEPSLNVLGRTVEKVTHGKLGRRYFVFVVGLGIAIGSCLGVFKVLLDINMKYILVPLYLLALVLTYYSDVGISCVAWDAGGVTTGSVTVPLILAMGLGLGAKRQPPVADGFGLLGCASIFPILTVLMAHLWQKHFQDKLAKAREPLLESSQ